VTRIIAGAAGGRALQTPPGAGTRPTSDRVREALFSALEARGALTGAQVLDLYAGSGALGLEAVSRGAAGALFVESDRRAAAVVRANVAALGVSDRCTVVASSVRAALAREPADLVDLVLADPPYLLAEDELAADLHRLAGGWLAAGAVVVVERSSRSPEPSWPVDLVPEKPRRYGDTTIWIATRA